MDYWHFHRRDEMNQWLGILIIIKVYFSSILHRNNCCGYSLESPRRGDSNEYHNIYFCDEIWKKYPEIITKYQLFHGRAEMKQLFGISAELTISYKKSMALRKHYKLLYLHCISGIFLIPGSFQAIRDYTASCFFCLFFFLATLKLRTWIDTWVIDAMPLL